MASARPTAPVLIVEDNDDTRQALVQVLQIAGYTTAEASNGQKALAYLRAGHPVALIVLDLRMPVLDGWTLLEFLKNDAKLEHIPVIAFSANVQAEVPKTVATLRKATVDPDMLLRIIEQVIVKEMGQDHP